MPSNTKINPSSRANPNIGFGVQASQIGGRFVNKDGSFNLQKVGYPLTKTMSLYSLLLELSWLQFFTYIILFYFIINCLYTGLYIISGLDQLQGFTHSGYWEQVLETFFFSTETFTTVGYGRVNPVGTFAHIISSIEAYSGWLSFSIVTGLLYGRFTRPKAHISFSHNAVVAPYKQGKALMFRMATYKSKHDLADAMVKVNIAYLDPEQEKPVYQFYQLPLERSRIDSFNMNWTVVHPIDEKSPLLNLTEEDMQRSDLEIYVHVSGFDNVYSNVVMQRTSYTYKEIIWGARFVPMYHVSDDGSTTVLELNKLNEYSEVTLPA